MTYYDTFELRCGCRIRCKCPKAKFCSHCGKTQVFKLSYPDWRCQECGSNLEDGER